MLPSPLQVPVHSYRPLDVQVVVKDAEGRRFDNFSSLHFDWSLSDNALATFAAGSSDVTTEIFADYGHPMTIISKHKIEIRFSL